MDQVTEALNDIAALRDRDRSSLQEILNSDLPLSRQGSELRDLLCLMKDTEAVIASYYGMSPEFVNLMLN